MTSSARAAAIPPFIRSNPMSSPVETHPHPTTRHEWPSRQRRLTVVDTQAVTPRMRRITFASPELHDFRSLGADDHLKLLLPAAGSGESCRRDYTIRRFDPAARTLQIDFALHRAGPATAWALAARPGDRLEVAGPRKSIVVADDFDWLLLVGDATALPAIGRRLEELHSGQQVTTLVLVDDDGERQAIATRARWQAHWLSRDAAHANDDTALLTAACALVLPPGDGYVWIAAEAQANALLREHFLQERGHPREWLKASNYWHRAGARP